MRVKLSIQRHGLPSVDLLWNVSNNPAQTLQTISNLLEEINEAVPLEAPEWGLEDYVVEVEGFECLHYSPLSQILKDGDHVCVRPLQTPELRARRVSGREQISATGIHLLDGIPFGKTGLKRPARPAIHIPPRKRTRLLPASEGENDGSPSPEPRSRQARLTNGDNCEHDDEEEGDEDFVPDEESTEQVAIEDRPDVRYGKLRPSRKVRFDTGEKENVLALLPSDDVESDEEFEGGGSNSSDSECDSEDDEEEEVAEAAKIGSKSTVVPNSETDSDTSLNTETDSSSDDSDSDSDSDSESSSEPESQNVADAHAKNTNGKTEAGRYSAPSDSDSSSSDSEPEVESTRPKTGTSLPYEGLSRTQARNRRRVEAKALKRLKSLGVLPENASVAELHAHLANRRSTEIVSDAAASRTLTAEEEGQREALLRDLENGGVDVTPVVISAESSNKRKSRRSNDGLADDSGMESPKKRARFDLPGSKRLLEASLVPKAKADEEAIATKIQDCAKVKATNVPDEEQTPIADHGDFEDVDAWKSKIVLNAVECCEDGIALSTPPFPFVQRWDPQQVSGPQRNVQNGNKQRKKKRRQRNKTDYYDNVRVYAEDDEEPHIVLNYDEEVPESAEPSGTHVVFDDDLPLLPLDVENLAVLTVDDAIPGAIIVFKLLDMSLETNWQPLISDWRTAKIDSIKDAGDLEMTLAQRDWSRREILYDDKGNRIYEKFEMQNDDVDEEEVDDGYRCLNFSELLEPKLLEPAPVRGKIEPDTPHEGNTAVSWNGIPDTPPDVDAEVSAVVSGVDGALNALIEASA